jgi:hypothetical protein
LKKRKRQLDLGTEARRRAREKVGLPPSERVIPDKRRKKPKHKKPVTSDEW